MQLPNLNSFLTPQSGINTQQQTSTPGYASGGFNLASTFANGKPTYNPTIQSSPSLSTTDPSKVAASTTVASPATTAAQSNSIAKGANSGSLTSQLYNLPTGGQTTAQGGYAGSPATNPNFKAPTTSTTPTTSTGYGDQTAPGTTVSTSNISPLAGGTQGTSTTGNALLDDPKLQEYNSDAQSAADQLATTQKNQNNFIAQETKYAIANPMIGDSLNNAIGASSPNAIAAAAQEEAEGLDLTAANAAFANREGQVKDANAPTTLGNIAFNPYTGEQVASTPTTVAPGSTLVNSTTGSQIAGGLGGYESYQNAQNVNSQMASYPDAVNAQGQKFTYDNTQTPQQNLQNFEQNYLPNSPTYQKSTYGEAGANSVYGAGKIAGNASAISTNTETAGELSGIRDSVSNMSNSLISQLSTAGNFNPSDLTAVNSAVQTIAANTSNPQYQILNNQMTDIAATYANILNPGASTDYTKSLSQGLINQLAKGSTIQQVIQGLDAQAQKKIAGYQTAAGDIESGTNPNPNSSQVGNTVTAPDGTQVIITD